MRKYVVSNGLEFIVRNWCKRRDLVSPDSVFFTKMNNTLKCELEKIFGIGNVDIIDYKTISNGIKKIVDNSNLKAVSLDRIYFQSELNLDVTRKILSVDSDKYITSNRFGTPTVKEQINLIKESDVREVVLVDDVGFSGGTIISIIEELHKNSIFVKKVCLGIGILEGIKNIAKYCDVECVIRYDSVIDEICEWDFYPGIPFSGRLIAGSDNIGKPYCEPFGKIVEWASIPKFKSKEFSDFLIKESINLFFEIEELSNVQILCNDLERKVYGMPLDSNIRVIDFLSKYIKAN